MSDFKVYLSSTIRAMSYSINVSIVVSSNSQNLLPFVQNSMYRGAMEPKEMYQSPFTLLNDKGVTGAMGEEMASKVVDLVREINKNAEAA